MTNPRIIAQAIDSAPLRTTASLALPDPRRRGIATEELAGSVKPTWQAGHGADIDGG